MQCLMVCKGDIDEAMKLYEFFASDMEGLPEFDPVPLSWQQNTAQTLNGVMDWLKANGDTLQRGWQFVQQVIANKGVLPVAAAEEAVTEPLPEIN
jgi:hypothetical protein